MSDTSRKRSRKSKLVPRECAVGEDEFDLELQKSSSNLAKIKKQCVKKIAAIPEPTPPKPEEFCDTSILKKINASALEDIESKQTSRRQFEINIEVESCHDEEEIPENIEDAASPTDEEAVKTLTMPEIRCSYPIILSREIVLDKANEILKTSTNIADNILNLHIRNTIGYEQQEQLELEWLETQIQEALNEWRTWQFRSFHREEPLFYKCYICTRSYWYLSEFRDHMTAEHVDDKTVNISLEKYEMHEANVIAYHKKLIVIKDIYTPGLCYRCGKDYNAHELELREHKRYYSSGGCSKQFFSCMGVRDHFPWCLVCKIQDKPIKCDICKSRFDTDDDLSSHLLLSHTVRSDIPISVRYKTCKLCLQRYCCSYIHNCGDKSPHLECPHCLMGFSSQILMEIHMESANVPYNCEICNVAMKYSCQKYEHMLEHTDKFIKVKKCVNCEGLNVFVNKDDALAHRVLNHDSKDPRQLSYFPNILIPKACQYHSLAEPEMVSTDQETVTEKLELAQNEKGLVSESEAETVSESEPGLVAASQQDLMQEGEESTMESVIIKEEPEDSEGPEDFEEPEDSEDSPRLVIKEELFEEDENQIHYGVNETDNFKHQIVKEELVEEDEEEEYEEDIIKMNFNIEHLLVKQESTEEEDEHILSTSDDTQDLDYENSEESLPQATQKDEYILLNSDDTQDLDDENSEESLPQATQKEESISEEAVALPGDKKHKRSYRCTACGFVANHRLYREHIDYDCKKNSFKTYVCTKCDKKFLSMKKYLGHFEEHGYKPLTCPECQKDFLTYTLLGQHIQRHVKQSFVRVKLITEVGGAMSKLDHQCRRCGETVATKNFFEHWELHVSDRPKELVKVPSRALLNKDVMHEDMVKECIARLSKQPKECVQCHHRFKRVNECKRHLIEHLLSDAYKHKHTHKELRCQICDNGFPNPEKYKQHMRDHALLPVYKCELCDRTFSDSSNFTKHKKVHNLKVLVCDLCGKKFQSKTSLEKHIEKHKTTEPIPCKLCNKEFYFETTYRRHVRYFHNKTKLGFRCAICGERFDSIKWKWDHMWEVHKERKHKADCPICHKSFRKYSDVRSHARSAHGKEVSVLSVKKATTPKKSAVKIHEFLKTKKPKHVDLGTVETLVIYDSD